MNYCVLDLETERELREVGGKSNLHLLGVSVVGIYERGKDTFTALEKEEFSLLEDALRSTDLLIGFNIRHFDMPVLAPHISLHTQDLRLLDLMDDVERSLGFRMSLDNLSRATLGAGKSGMGLEAIQWWRAGEKEKVKAYCIKDVRLTRDLFEFGRSRGYVLADTRDKGRVRVPVRWAEAEPRKIALQESPYVQRSLI